MRLFILITAQKSSHPLASTNEQHGTLISTTRTMRHDTGIARFLFSKVDPSPSRGDKKRKRIWHGAMTINDSNNKILPMPTGHEVSITRTTPHCGLAILFTCMFKDLMGKEPAEYIYGMACMAGDITFLHVSTPFHTKGSPRWCTFSITLYYFLVFHVGYVEYRSSRTSGIEDTANTAYYTT